MSALPRVFAYLFLLPAFVSAALADDRWQSQPEGPVILTVTGPLGCCPEGVALFDQARLDALPQTQVKTLTPWTEQVDTFEGVSIRDLLVQLQASGRVIEAKALNDYHTRFEVQTVLDYPVILATRKNGEPMPVRNKGPIWIIYPLSDFPPLRKELHHQAMVWQLKSLTIIE
ncbi:molybdopterin-dependent oxidoreductase [Pseudomonas indica]|uniref:molybdopterin-dependent oxidoreductase n=1 Tax=Pseudomonas indica TaxID=137658 RepID=UPI003FD29BCD